jgi:DNA-binding CsgD family transcriptional regulator
VTVLDLLVQARLAEGDVPAADFAASGLEALASDSGVDQVVAYAERARGRVASATDVAGGLEHLERAEGLFSGLGMENEVGRTRLDLARVLREVDRQASIAEARSALSSLHATGSSFERDQAAALLRELGDDSRPVATQQIDDLTAREVEVLRLLGEGLTNAEIAGRLFISIKTAGNHVSNILMKLGLRNRSQAAGVARSHLGAEQERV